MLLQAFRAVGLSAAIHWAPALTVPALTQGLATTTKSGTPRKPRTKKTLPEVLSDKVSAASGKKSQKKKKIINDAQPPRALSAYTCYIKANAAKQPKGVAIKETFRNLASNWHELTEAERAPYVEMAAQTKLAAEAARAEWKSQQAPSKPPNPYANFVKEVMPGLMAENPGKKVYDLMSQVSAKWREMPTAEKTRRQEQHKAALALHKASQEAAAE